MGSTEIVQRLLHEIERAKNHETFNLYESKRLESSDKIDILRRTCLELEGIIQIIRDNGLDGESDDSTHFLNLALLAGAKGLLLAYPDNVVMFSNQTRKAIMRSLYQTATLAALMSEDAMEQLWLDAIAKRLKTQGHRTSGQ